MLLMSNDPPFGKIGGVWPVVVRRDIEWDVGWVVEWMWLYSVVVSVSDIKVSQSIPLNSPVQIHSQGLEQYPFLHPG